MILVRHLVISILAVLLIVIPSVVNAACTNPVGPEGAILFNEDQHVPQICAGSSWVALGALNPSAGSGPCSNPTMPKGALVYNNDFDVLQYCDGTNWIAVQAAPPPSGAIGAPPGAGYFIAGGIPYSGCFGREIDTITRVGTTATVSITYSEAHNLKVGAVVTVSGNTPAQYNGTFTITAVTDSTFSYTMGSTPPSDATVIGYYCFPSGRAAADTLCYNELTTNTGWWGYGDASVRGLLTPSNVKAWICDNTTCNNLLPNTSYYFSNVFDTGAGGASFTTDGSGSGPGVDWPTWGMADYFGVVNSYASKYWTGRDQGTDTYWSNSPSGSSCSNWTSSTTGDGEQGIAGSTGRIRWKNWGPQVCDDYTANWGTLVCYVNP